MEEEIPDQFSVSSWTQWMIYFSDLKPEIVCWSSYMPVSYTHLDVYKGQLLYRAAWPMTSFITVLYWGWPEPKVFCSFGPLNSQCLPSQAFYKKMISLLVHCETRHMIITSLFFTSFVIFVSCGTHTLELTPKTLSINLKILNLLWCWCSHLSCVSVAFLIILFC